MDSEAPKAGKLLIPTLNDQEGAPRRWPLPRLLASLRAAAAPEGQNGASGVVALFDTVSVPHSWVTVGMRSLPVFGAAAVRVEAQRRTIRM